MGLIFAHLLDRPTKDLQDRARLIIFWGKLRTEGATPSSRVRNEVTGFRAMLEKVADLNVITFDSFAVNLQYIVRG